MEHSPAIAAETSLAPASRIPASLRAILEEIHRDRLLYGVVGVYVLTVGAVAIGAGKPEFFQPFLYLTSRWPMVALGFVLYLLLIEVPAAVIADPSRPMTALAGRMRGCVSPRMAANLTLFVAIGLFISTFTSMKVLQNMLVPFWADAPLARIDAWLHFGVDPWRLLQPALGHPAVTRFFQILYLYGWVSLLIGFTTAAAFSSRLAHVRQRFFLTYLIAWIGIGNVFASILMSGGPVYYAQLTKDHARYAELTRYLSFSDGMAGSSTDLQRGLWDLYVSGQMQLGSGISAFPSVHVATATLFALTGFAINRWIGWATTVFALLILVGSVHLGWHYGIGGYFAAGFVLAVWFGLERLPRPAP